MMLLAGLAGCATDEPVVVSREALGTAVSITAYGEDEVAVREAIEDAYQAMAAVEAKLNVHDPDSALSAFNADPYEPRVLPAAATEVLDAVADLAVAAEFSPSLLAVTRLYGFEETPAVPDMDDLALAVMAARRFGCAGEGAMAFVRLTDPDRRLEPGGALTPGLDLGGATKGLALDRAREALRASGSVTAALVTAGSTTVTLGTRPDGTAWRIGVEDPREIGRVVAVFTLEGEGALSTSGDYQRFFEEGGVRYHHIIDPETGLPARGLRSLTVAGTGLSGLASDILSTALFVRGADGAATYAGEHGLALYLVDAEGRAHVVPAPDASGPLAEEQAQPLP
jgi:thiamine biosynthesis lipoprotein